MRAVVQRVSRAKVTVGAWTSGEIGWGLLVLLGVGAEDTESDAHYLAEKVAGLRIFEDENGKMNLDVNQVSGSAMVISQFTLYGDASKGWFIAVLADHRLGYVHETAVRVQAAP